MNYHATRRCGLPRLGKGERWIHGGGRRRGGSMARGGVQKSEKFVNFLRLYRPRDHVRYQLI